MLMVDYIHVHIIPFQHITHIIQSILFLIFSNVNHYSYIYIYENREH